MEMIEGYNFYEVLEIISDYEIYRGYEYTITKRYIPNGIIIKSIESDSINWDNLQKELFIKVK